MQVFMDMQQVVSVSVCGCVWMCVCVCVCARARVCVRVFCKSVRWGGREAGL